MPGHGTIRLRGAGGFAPSAGAGSTVAPMPTSGPVGHGTTRLIARPAAYNAVLVPGAPPPTQETAKAYGHGAISLRT